MLVLRNRNVGPTSNLINHFNECLNFQTKELTFAVHNYNISWTMYLILYERESNCEPCIYRLSTPIYMMMSSNGNIFRVTGHLCGEFTGPGEFPAQRPVTRSFGVFFDLRLHKQLSKQP